MKTPAFKTLSIVCFCVLSMIVLSCKKPDTPASSSVTYASLIDFYAKNGVQSQFYKINSVTGGSFITSQGTKVTISPNSFVDFNNKPVSGTVTIEFKDIYKKSDMLVSAIPPMLGNGAPLVSGGSFLSGLNKLIHPILLSLILQVKNQLQCSSLLTDRIRPCKHL